MAEDVLLVRTEELRVVLEELDALRTAFLERAEEPVVEETPPPVPATDPALLETLSVMASRAERAEAAIGRLEADLAHVGELHEGELTTLEAALRERAQTIQSLDREILRRERLVQELVSTVEELRELALGSASIPPHIPAPSSHDDAGRLRAQIEQMSLEIARREGELEARAWRIAELEREVTLTTEALHTAAERADRAIEHAPTVHYTGEIRDPRDSDEAREVTRLRQELDALRQALAQEHQGRQQADKVRVESGSLLEEARAELARQTVLIEQLSRELATRTPGPDQASSAS